MCGRYGFSVKDEKEVLNRFDIVTIKSDDHLLRTSYNVAPTQTMPVVEKHSPNALYYRAWGVQPSWSKMLLINAKVEKLAESRFWKSAFATSRCIVPASWFYEWKKLSDGKQPYLIRLKNQEMFGFAGLTVTAKDDKGEDKTGYVIITTAANEIMSPIHERMPVILEKEDEEAWLNPDTTEPEKLLPLLKQYPTDKMEAYPISSLVNAVKNNIPEVLKEVKI